LRKLLDEERRAILTGDYDALADIALRKRRLLGDHADTSTASVMASIVEKLGRNQELLAHAIDGMRSATGRISAIRQQRDGFQSYGRDGQRSQVGGQTAVIERKV